jgi:hypothetical protein
MKGEKRPSQDQQSIGLLELDRQSIGWPDSTADKGHVIGQRDPTSNGFE